MKETTLRHKEETIGRLLLGMSIFYLLFLIWAVLWKCGILFIGDGTQRFINLVPFRGNTTWEMEFNILVFLPFGFFFSACRPDSSFLKRLLAILFTTIALEAVQFVLSIGRSDVTDVIMNTLGGIIGILLFYVISLLFKRNARKASLIVCVFFTLAILYMTISFLIFGQLYLGFMMIRL